MSPGRFVRSSWLGFEAQHRYEDLALIREVIQAHRPLLAIELGTALGGFAAFLADTLAWSGAVLTVDRVRPATLDALAEACPNLTFLEADILGAPGVVRAVIERAEATVGNRLLLYCDDGDKTREVSMFAPALPVGALLGCHDYGTEAKREVIDPLLAELGYLAVRHADFEALADPVNYPASLTRFWRRERA